MKIFSLIFTLFIIACNTTPPPEVKKEPRPLTAHDHILFDIGECSRSRRNPVTKACLERYTNHVFKGKLLTITDAKIGVEALVDIGQTEVTCHIQPSDQTWRMLKSLVTGDIVAVNGKPEDFHNTYSYNNLLLSDCTLLPIKRFTGTKKEIRPQ